MCQLLTKTLNIFSDKPQKCPQPTDSHITWPCPPSCGVFHLLYFEEGQVDRATSPNADDGRHSGPQIRLAGCTRLGLLRVQGNSCGRPGSWF